MKFLILAVVAGLAFGSADLSGVSTGIGTQFPETDDYIDSYAYDATVCSSIPASFGDYRVVDDFTPVVDGADIVKFIYWGLSTATTPTSLNLMWFADASGTPGTEVSQTPYSITTGASGFEYAGYTVWTTEMVVNITGVEGTNWFGFHRPTADTWYVGIGPIVTGYEAHRTLAAGYAWQPMSSSIEAADLFKIIEGTVTALDRSTWGGIKVLF